MFRSALAGIPLPCMVSKCGLVIPSGTGMLKCTMSASVGIWVFRFTLGSSSITLAKGQEEPFPAMKVTLCPRLLSSLPRYHITL